LQTFLSPYDPTIAGRDKEYENGAPQIPMFWDKNGFSPRPFLHTLSNIEVRILTLDGYIK
jgi:peptide/nickel transport system permease protein